MRFNGVLPAQVLPMYPAGQVHVNLLTPSLHCPPFLHGLLAHSLTSLIKQREMGRALKKITRHKPLSQRTKWQHTHVDRISKIHATIANWLRAMSLIIFLLSSNILIQLKYIDLDKSVFRSWINACRQYILHNEWFLGKEEWIEHARTGSCNLIIRHTSKRL